MKNFCFDLLQSWLGCEIKLFLPKIQFRYRAEELRLEQERQARSMKNNNK